MAAEVSPRCLRDIKLLARLHSLNATDLINITGTGCFACKVSVGVCVTSLDVTGDIEGVSRSLGDGQPVVESDTSRDGTEADNNTPHSVNSGFAANIAIGR